MSQPQPPATRVVLRPVATPLPVAMLGLAVASGTYAALELGWVPAMQSHIAAFAALFFTVPLQLVGTVVGFATRDSVASTGVAVQAGLWAVTGLNTLTSAPGATNPAFGVVLIAVAAALVVPALGAGSKPVAALVFVTTASHSCALGLHELSGDAGWKTVSGVIGLVLASLALYAAAAFELEGAYERGVLPIGRRCSAVAQGEPGVRRRL